MAIIGTIEVPPHSRPSDLTTLPWNGYLAGDYMVWPVMSENYDAMTTFDGTGVAIAHARRDEPVRFIDDTRCVGADGGWVDENGDFYLLANALFGVYTGYGDLKDTAKSCVLRIRKNDAELDPDYMFDHEAVVGSNVSYAWYHVKGPKRPRSVSQTVWGGSENKGKYTGRNVRVSVDRWSTSATSCGSAFSAVGHRHAYCLDQ